MFYYDYSVQPTSECKFGTSPAIHVEETRSQFTASLFGFQLINLGSSLITASLAIKVEDVSLLYVAQIDHISVVSIVSSSALQNLFYNLDVGHVFTMWERYEVKLVYLTTYYLYSMRWKQQVLEFQLVYLWTLSVMCLL